MLIRAVIWLAVFLIAMGAAATLLAADYDMRADIYAVGATMYYLLTLANAFSACAWCRPTGRWLRGRR